MEKFFSYFFPPPFLVFSAHICPLLIKAILRGSAFGRLNLALVGLSQQRKRPEDTKFYSIPFTELLGNGMGILITCFWGVRRNTNTKLQLYFGLQVEVENLSPQRTKL